MKEPQNRWCDNNSVNCVNSKDIQNSFSRDSGDVTENVDRSSHNGLDTDQFLTASMQIERQAMTKGVLLTALHIM